jgi:hypothetical protein
VPKLSSEASASLQKSRDAALLAVETYNRPGTVFRSGGYIVLMVIAWTALLHAGFFKRKVKPYYRKKGSKRFEKVNGDYKAWELAECVAQYFKDKSPPERKNLELFIGLRNKIEHRFLPELDIELFGECQALLLNFEAFLCKEFGEVHALAPGLPYALQFSKSIEPTQQRAMRGVARQYIQSIRQFVSDFRSSLSDDVLGDQAYSFKVFLIPKVGTHAKSSDIAVEFVKYDANKPEEMKQYERLVALVKPKQISVANLEGLKATEVVKKVAAGLGKKFTLHSHLKCWRHFNTRPAGHSDTPELCDNRYCYYDVLHKDYIYTPAWVDFLVEKLGDAATYDLVLKVAV